MTVVCTLAAVAVLGRAAYIQLIGDPRLDSLAKKQFSSKVLMKPRRGMIQDRNGEPLAVNLEIQSLAANPAKIRNRNTLARLLAKAMDLPLHRVEEKLKGKREFVWIKRHLSDADMGKLKRWGILDASGDLTPGLWMVAESRRVYPHGELAAHVLGSTNLDSEGLEGVELWGNSLLEGQFASVNAVRDALGRPAFLDASGAAEVKNGDNVRLALDASLQFAVERELKDSLQKTGARAGTVIVMNAVNGEILSLANEPSFNPNGNPNGARSGALAAHRNRAFTDGFEPGSILKPVLLASALQRGHKLTDKIYGEKGSIVIQGKRIREAEAHEKFEWMTLKHMIKISSNVGAAKLALKLGPDAYLESLKQFGFGSESGSGFPGEISGLVPPRRRWHPLTLANIGFGHGILVTPIQMLRSYAAFFNGGWLVQPTLVTTQMPRNKALPPVRILSQKAADDVVDALVAVTEHEGTGINAGIQGYQVAGKTGTAQMVDPTTGRYSHSRYVASFVGSAIGVEPKLVIFTALEEPKGAYYGSEIAAPLFRSVLAAAANRFSLPSQPLVIKDKLLLTRAKPVAEPEESQAEAIPTTIQDGVIQWKLPSLAGLTLREAVRLLRGRDFQIEARGSGLIQSQIPEPNKAIKEGALLRLQLSEP